MGLREINHNAGRVFREVGNETIVTEYGRPRWRITPIRPSRSVPGDVVAALLAPGPSDPGWAREVEEHRAADVAEDPWERFA